MSSETVETVYGLMPRQLSCASLKDLCVDAGIQTGPFGSQLHKEDYVQKGTPIITVEHLGENRIVHSNLPQVSDEDKARLSKYVLKKGDIVFSRVGSVDRRALVQPAEDGWLFSGRCLRVRPNPDQLDAQWLSYFFGLPAFKNYIRGIAVGATMPSLNTKILSDVPVYFPDLSTQKTAAEVLAKIDDRITLLRETNTTLEAIAQALFKSWFVDFDPVHAKMQGRAPEGMDEATAALFPDVFEESELGAVPKGWKMAALRDCCNKIESGGTPKRSVIEYWNGRYSWLTSGEVRNPIVFETKETITDEGLKDSSAKLWPHGTTVIAMYGATAGEVCLIASPMTANQACCGLIPRPSFRAFLFFCSRRECENLASKSSGSAQQNLNKGLVERHAILLPNVGVVAAYEAVVGLLLDRWIEGERHSQTLANLRNTLLPRLISGQLRLPDSSAILESVA